jgi:hypothetical protein
MITTAETPDLGVFENSENFLRESFVFMIIRFYGGTALRRHEVISR